VNGLSFCYDNSFFMLPVSYCRELRDFRIFVGRKDSFGDAYWVCDTEYKDARAVSFDESFILLRRSNLTLFSPSLEDMVKYMADVDPWVRIYKGKDGWVVLFDKIVSDAHKDLEISAADAIIKYVKAL